ncbi:MAG: A24 family peptidase, partial [Planctomycetota bacterium]
MADAGGRWLFGDGGVWATAPGWLWTIETGGPTQWSWIGGSAGAVLGLGGSALLVRFGLLGRSFEDYEEWEREAEAREKAEAEQAKQESAEGEGGGPASDDDEGRGAQGAQTPGGASSPLASSPASASDDPAAMWIRYPHARREMLKEVAFLGAPAVLGTVGWVLAGQLGGPAWEIGSQAPLWLVVLGGVLCGYLVGGGLVWGVRIFGSLAFGKEAMGLGDVHLMAAVGACVGWVDAVVAFFVAAFLALGHAVLGAVFGGAMRRAMPFGPFLAGGTVLVLLGRPVVEWGLGLIMASDGPVRLP